MIHNITEPIYDSIITKQNIDIHYQPIVSLKSKKVVGLEALTRASYNNEMINPEALFEFAKSNYTAEILDGICIKKSVEEFAKIQEEQLLFINFEASSLPLYIEKTDDVINELKKTGIDSSRIVIEINEKAANSNDTIKEFIKIYRSEGFLIALDDVGSGHSNLNRIAVAKPDIVKIDRDAISSLDTDYYKQEITRAIVGLASRIGAVTIAEGVETINEAVTCLEMGVDLFQGYYFSKAIPNYSICKLDLDSHYKIVGLKYKNQSENNINKRKLIISEYRHNIFNLVNNLTCINQNAYDELIKNFICDIKSIQCVYIIDEDGYQITDTIFCDGIEIKSNYFVSPGIKGTRHDVKSYYYSTLLVEPQVHITHRYVSAATASLCETVSIVFRGKDGKKLIACMDYSVPNDY